MNAPNLPLNEPLTDFESVDVKNKLKEALDAVNAECKEIPIVIGGKEYRTDDAKYQVSVCNQNFNMCYVLFSYIWQL